MTNAICIMQIWLEMDNYCHTETFFTLKNIPVKMLVIPWQSVTEEFREGGLCHRRVHDKNHARTFGKQMSVELEENLRLMYSNNTITIVQGQPSQSQRNEIHGGRFDSVSVTYNVFQKPKSLTRSHGERVFFRRRNHAASILSSSLQ